MPKLSVFERIARACYEHTPCLLVAYNLGPLVVGFVGGLFGALLPLLALEIVSPGAGKEAMVVLANAAAGASAGIAAATARRPALVRVRELVIHQPSETRILLALAAENKSSVGVRELIVSLDSLETETTLYHMWWSKSGATDNIFIETSGACCKCPGCRIEAREQLEYKRASTRMGAPTGEMIAGGVKPVRIPPGGVAEIPFVELEAIDFSSCELWEDCSPYEKCLELGSLIASKRVWLLVRLLAGPRETIATYLAPLSGTSLNTIITISGDPVPRVKEEAQVSIKASIRGRLVLVEISTPRRSVERYVRPLKCIPHPGGIRLKP